MGEYYGVRRTGDEPYIEHWGVPKGWTKQGHKYLARLVSNTGKGYRYIYSQAELAAAKAGKLAGQAGKSANSAYKTVRKNVNNAVTGAKKSLGVYARRDMNRKWDALGTTRNPYSKAKSNKLERFMAARRAYEKTPLGRVESFKNRTIENAQQAYYGAEKKAKRLAKDARSGATKVAKDAQKYVNKQAEKAKKVYDDYQNFKKLPQWQKDIAVNADRKGVKKVMGRSVQGAAMASRLEGIENAIRRTTGSARKAADDAIREGRRAYGKTSRAVSRTARQVGRDIGKAVDSASKAVGLKAKMRYEGATARRIKLGQKSNFSGEDFGRANQTARRARAAYYRTPMGKVEKGVQDAYRRVGDAFDNARDTVKNAPNRIGRTVRDTKRNAETQTKRAIRSTSVGRDIDDRVGLTKQGRHNRRNDLYKEQVLSNREYNRHRANYSKKRKAQIKRKKGISGSTHNSNSF